MKFRKTAILFLATGCFAGKIPVAPGTFGSLAGLPLCFIVSRLGIFSAILFAVFIILMAIWIADKASVILGREDPACIVIDEIAGITVTLIGLPFEWTVVIAGFFLFRLFDIWKPFPVRYLEKRLKGGLGIVMDDVAAGLLGQIILRGALLLLCRYP